MTSPFTFGPGVNPIPLANEEPADNAVAVVTGWGTINTTSDVFPTQLQMVSVNIISRERCDSSFNEQTDIPEDMICAGVVGGGKDSCNYDSGGPLVVGGKQVGIVSWGYGCGGARYPGIYSNVAVLREFVVNVTGID